VAALSPILLVTQANNLFRPLQTNKDSLTLSKNKLKLSSIQLTIVAPVLELSLKGRKQSENLSIGWLPSHQYHHIITKTLF